MLLFIRTVPFKNRGEPIEIAMCGLKEEAHIQNRWLTCVVDVGVLQNVLHDDPGVGGDFTKFVEREVEYAMIKWTQSDLKFRKN